MNVNKINIEEVDVNEFFKILLEVYKNYLRDVYGIEFPNKDPIGHWVVVENLYKYAYERNLIPKEWDVKIFTNLILKVCKIKLFRVNYDIFYIDCVLHPKYCIEPEKGLSFIIQYSK